MWPAATAKGEQGEKGQAGSEDGRKGGSNTPHRNAYALEWLSNCVFQPVYIDNSAFMLVNFI